MKYILVFFLLMVFTVGFSQKKNKANVEPKKDTIHISVHVKAQNYGDSIVVRWAPANSVSWLLSQKEGYLIRRKVFTKKEKTKFTLVDSSSIIIRPWSLNDWAAYFKSSHDSLSAIAAQVSYGKTLQFDNGKNGNSFNSITEKYNEQQNRFGFALILADFDPEVANGMGFRFVEKHPKKDLYYLYSIIPAPNNHLMKIDTGRVFVEPGAYYQKETFPVVTAVAGDKIIKLHWDDEQPMNNFSGYIIEKSEDGKNFTRINRLPFVAFKKNKNIGSPVEFSDSVIRDYKNYYYRVSGINAFGDHSSPSKLVIVQSVDLTPPQYPVISSIKANPVNGSIQLQWTKKEKENDFKGYVVGRSTNMKGPFEPLSKKFLPFGTTTFTDEHPDANAPNYYIVAAVDTAGNAGRSMPAYMNIDDHTPPGQPNGLTGKIDSNGIVTVQWNWGKEKDLAGYKIFFANSPNQIFTPLNGDLLTDSSFRDSITLKTLTKRIYYKVIAYDKSMNPSVASSILALAKPDKIAPVAAIIKSFLVTDSGVSINWMRSPSNDVAKQIIYRKQDSSASWSLLSPLLLRDSTFTDNQVQPRHNYSYAIETIDSSGLSSGKSFPLQVYVYESGKKGGIKNFQVTNSNGSNLVSMKWTPPPGEINYYILYKGKENEGMRMAGNVPGDNITYSEKEEQGNYQFALKAIFKNGSASALSEIKSIQIK